MLTLAAFDFVEPYFHGPGNENDITGVWLCAGRGLFYQL